MIGRLRRTPECDPNVARKFPITSLRASLCNVGLYGKNRSKQLPAKNGAGGAPNTLGSTQAWSCYQNVSSRAGGADVAKLRLVRQPQLADETVYANCETPNAVLHCARELRALRRRATAYDAHLLFLTVHDLARVDRQTITRFLSRDSIDNDLVMTRRRMHSA